MKNLVTTFVVSSMLAADALAQSSSAGGSSMSSAGANSRSVVIVPSGTTTRANVRQGAVRRVNPAEPTQSVNTAGPGTLNNAVPQAGSAPLPNTAAPTVNSVPPAVVTGPGTAPVFTPLGAPQNSANTQVPIVPNQSVQSAFQQPLGTPLFNTTTPNTTPINTVPAVSNAPAGPNAVNNGFNFVPNAFTNVPIATNRMTPGAGFPANLPVRPAVP